MILVEWGRLCLQSKLFDRLGARRVLALLFSCYKASDYLRPRGLQPTSLHCPWDFPGKSTGVDCHLLLQGIFQTQGLNLGLLHCRQILYQLSHQGMNCQSRFDAGYRILRAGALG